MIDEKKLIERIEKQIELNTKCYINNISDEYSRILDKKIALLKWMINLVKSQPKVNKWIPVEERLPDKKGLYLVSYHPCHWDNVWDEIRVGIDTFRGKTSWAKKEHQKVIAWMPLPEPYKGVIE